MVIQPLDWDSNHFNLRVGRVSLDYFSEQMFQSLTKRNSSYDLIYVFSNKYDSNLPNAINTKVYFIAHYSDLKPLDSNHIVKINKEHFNRIYDLSLVAGGHSRFKLDKNLNQQAFYDLYNKWVEKSFSANQIVFGYVKNEEVLGMISIKFDPFKNIADIELIGVDPKAQGMQIGSKLIYAGMNYVRQKSNISFITVQTQKENIQACQFYLKCGFKEQNFLYIHHIWTKE